MFVSGDVLLDAGFHDAWDRLSGRVPGRLLVRASQDAYAEGITGLTQAGAAGLPRLTEVQSQDMVTRDGSAVLPLRWQAIGPDGGLFPALDADITLTPAGEHATLLRLHGVYRLPPTTAGPRPGRAIADRVAMGTVQAFLRRVAEAITHPARAN